LASWRVQDAKARFSELLETTMKKGPQMVTRRGVEVAVLVPIEEWHRLQHGSRPGLKALLLAPAPALENPVRKHRVLRRRGTVWLREWEQ
jgi:prevent-host-death family protein